MATAEGLIVSRYRELVQQQLAVDHAGIELKLARAREQEGFVLSVERKLSAGSWSYQMGMTANLRVVFYLVRSHLPLNQQYQTVKEALLTCGEVEFDVDNRRPCLHVGSRQQPGIDCQVIFWEDADEHAFNY
ncbi:hypothetical protein [Eikenella sp. NML120348]|uniref:hypothetical protein n=1 Tax=Eikenella sp. NML120348 TaxID=1795831 RepID=UPI0007E0E81A|nr:hypothetical protein [Eikenella sp. NML120348]OAM38325.1 hypothetical protein A7P99_03955 [Eikenella sp. NML120348]